MHTAAEVYHEICAPVAAHEVDCGGLVKSMRTTCRMQWITGLLTSMRNYRRIGTLAEEDR